MYHRIITISLLYRLSQLKKLQVLALSFNLTLGEVPEVVYSLSQLTELRLSCCELSNISDRYVDNDYTAIFSPRLFHISFSSSYLLILWWFGGRGFGVGLLNILLISEHRNIVVHMHVYG